MVVLLRKSYRNVYFLVDTEQILNFAYWNVSSGKDIFIREYCLRHSSKGYLFVNNLLCNSNNLNNVSGYRCHKLWWRDLVTGRRIAVEFASSHSECVNMILELCQRSDAIFMLVTKSLFSEHPLILNLTRCSRPEPY